MPLILLAAIELILKVSLVPLLEFLEDELVDNGYVSRDTADECHDNLMSAMRFAMPFFPMAARVIKKDAPNLLPVLHWAKDRYEQSEQCDSSK